MTLQILLLAAVIGLILFGAVAFMILWEALRGLEKRVSKKEEAI